MADKISRNHTLKYLKQLRGYYHIKYFRSYKDFIIHISIILPF